MPARVASRGGFLTGAPLGFCELDPLGRVRGLDATLRQALAARASAPQGGVLEDMAAPGWETRVDQALELLFAEGRLEGHELDLVGSREEPLRVALYGARTESSRPAEQRAHVFFVGLRDRARPESARRETRTREERRTRMPGEDAHVDATPERETLALSALRGGVAHEFNTLFQSILGNIELVLEDDDLLRETRYSLERAYEASTKAASLMDQYLAYAGAGAVVRTTFSPADLVVEMKGLLEASLSRRAELVIQRAEGVPLIEGDEAHIGRVIAQLVVNAADAIGKGRGRVVLRLGESLLEEGSAPADSADSAAPRAPALGRLGPGRYATIAVEDEGCGMDEDTLARAFEPFFTTKSVGRGLGLAAVCGIVRAHGGTIEVESSPGEGSTFRVLIPAAPPGREKTGSPGTREDLATRASGLRVLVVDDEAAVRDVASKMLSRLGCEVVLATDGLHAVELFRERHAEFGVVILDLTMPQMGGEEALAWMRQIDPTCRVLLSSGYPERDAIEKLGELAGGRVRFLRKPYRLPTLRRALLDILPE